jgi:hypothetical protein
MPTPTRPAARRARPVTVTVISMEQRAKLLRALAVALVLNRMVEAVGIHSSSNPKPQ